MGRQGRFEQRKRKKNRCAGSVLLIILAVLLVLVIAAVLFGIWYYQSFLDRIPRAEHVENSVSQEETDEILNDNSDASLRTTEVLCTKPSIVEAVTVPAVPTVQTSEDILNIMVIGQSARAGEEYHMADSMILLTVNRFTKTVTLTSFLRDAYLKLPDYKDLSGRKHSCGSQRLNVCYHMGYTFGGTADAMGMLSQCVYENFGVEVDFSVEVGFEGVEKIINYLGGIEVDLTQAEADYLNADDQYVYYDVQAGPTVLDGLATLSYARMRNAEGDAGSDIRRTDRQRLVMTKLIEKVRDMDVAGLQRVMNDFLPYVVTDMTNADITKCILEVFPIVGALSVETGTCPAATTYWGEIVNIGGYDTSVLRFDADQNRKLMTSLTEGS